jgi:hypothetical protein
VTDGVNLSAAPADTRGVRSPWRRVVAAVVAGAVAAACASTGVVPATAAPPPGAEACPIFPADSFWHADVRSLPVDPRSGAWLTAMGGTSRRLHPDFGDSGGPMPYGIPYKVVDGSHAKTGVSFDYADESDPGPYPFGPDIPVEDGSDAHALMVDRDSCTLSELFAASWNSGAPTAGSGAVFDLRSNRLRPSGWTSADAAGLAIFPGLLRRDEVVAGNVDHVVRLTAATTAKAFLWPARHQAGSGSADTRPPMGAWFRMKADYPTAGLHPYTVTILEAFKTHGLIVADNGSNWYVTGAADAGWEPRVLDELKAIPAGAFEAIDQSSLMVDPNSGAVRGGAAPVVTTVRVPTTVRAPAPTTTARPRTPATTAAPTTTVAPTTTTTEAPTTTAAPETTLPLLATTTPADDADPGTDEAATALRRTASKRSIAPLLAALVALLVVLGAIAVVTTMLRRRRAATVEAGEPATDRPERQPVP